MGLNNEFSRRIVFDLETYAMDGAADFLPVEDFAAPSNWKDPEKIAAYVAEARGKAVDRCALDLDLCRIVALGWQEEGREAHVELCRTEADERAAINYFWNLATDRHLVGFNCLHFDLPVLLRRGLYLNALRPSIQLDKYRHPQVTDLQMVLSLNGDLKLRGLSFYCKRFGIDVPDPLSGADIAPAVKANNWSGVEHHCLSDIEKTARLADRMGLYRAATAESAVA